MKLPLLCIGCIFLSVAAVAALGHGPTSAKWGARGTQSMYAVAMICAAASMAAMIPLSVAATWFPAYVGEAALAATVVRLLLTVALGMMYQLWTKPDMAPFLFWALVFYGLMLLIDTVFSVLMIRRRFGTPSPRGGGA